MQSIVADRIRLDEDADQAILSCRLKLFRGTFTACARYLERCVGRHRVG